MTQPASPLPPASVLAPPRLAALALPQGSVPQLFGLGPARALGSPPTQAQAPESPLVLFAALEPQRVQVRGQVLQPALAQLARLLPERVQALGPPRFPQLALARRPGQERLVPAALQQ